MHLVSVDTAWQLRHEQRDRIVAATSGRRRRRRSPQPPLDRLPGHGGPDTAA